MAPSRFTRVIRDPRPRYPRQWWMDAFQRRTTRIFFAAALFVAAWR